MLARLRSLSLLALLLVAASPGLGGVALQATHSCAAEAAAAAETSGHAHHGGHPDTPDEERCSCIGACHAAFYTAGPRAAIAASIAQTPRGRLPLSGTTHVAPAARDFHLLPPATAPPLS